MSCLFHALVGSANLGAQEPVWSLRVSAGALIPADRTGYVDDPYTGLRLGQISPTLGVDALRSVDCCVDLFLSATVPTVETELRTAAESADAGTVSPLLLHLGLNYRLHRRTHTTTRLRQWIYLSPFLAATTADRTALVTLGSDPFARPRSAKLHPAFGVGVGVGWRYRASEMIGLDLNAKWQHLRLRVGDHGRIPLSPLVVSGGVVARLF